MAKKTELALVNAKDLQVIEYRGQRVVTNEQLAAGYGTTVDRIRQNFNRNKSRFVEGKHYFQIEGNELNDLRVSFSDAQISPKTRSLTLWTERGAANHSKMLETDQAWDYFNELSEFYFTRRAALPAPTDLSRLQILQMAIDSEQGRLVEKERADEAERTKAEIGSRREATAMATASAAVRKSKQLAERLGESTKRATVTAVLNATGTEYKWAPLRKWCRANNVEAKFVTDERWGSVKSWPAEAWLAEYGVDLRKLFGGEA